MPLRRFRLDVDEPEPDELELLDDERELDDDELWLLRVLDELRDRFTPETFPFAISVRGDTGGGFKRSEGFEGFTVDVE